MRQNTPYRDSALPGPTPTIPDARRRSAGMDFHPDLRPDLADLMRVEPRLNACYGTGR